MNRDCLLTKKTERLLHVRNALISGHPGRLTPRTYGGMAQDLLTTFVANFWPGTGALGSDPRDLQHRVILKMKVPVLGYLALYSKHRSK